MTSMAQIATINTAVQAAALYIYSFMATTVFECLHVLQVVGNHHSTGGRLWFGLCAHRYAYVHGENFSVMWGSQISPLHRGQSL